MEKASGQWLGVRLDTLTSLLVGPVAFAAILLSQDAGRSNVFCNKKKLLLPHSSSYFCKNQEHYVSFLLQTSQQIKQFSLSFVICYSVE